MKTLAEMITYMDKATLRGGSVTVFSITQGLAISKKETMALLRDGAFKGFFAVTRCGTWTRTTQRVK